MSSAISTCEIWGPEYPAEGYYIPQTRMCYVTSSPRTGGAYRVSETVVNGSISQFSPEEKARLTTWLIDQRAQGEAEPTISFDVVDHIKNIRSLPIHERSDRLLKFLANQPLKIGKGVNVSGDIYASALAYSESTDIAEVRYIAKYLEAKGWIQIDMHFVDGTFTATVSVEGYNRIAEQAVNVNSAQAFVAMWFDDSMTDVFNKGIEPAIKDAGYHPLRIDGKEHIGKIDDEIIAEIRRSRFIVADFTQGESGARGGVHYESGFAHGLGLPVIFTCRNDSVGSLHFDTNHYNHIVWDDPADLREKLKTRILAVLGEGPKIQGSA